MDRRLLTFFASVAVMVGAAGYLLAQSRTETSEVVASPVTVLGPQSSSSTTTPEPAESTIRSTLPPTPVSEIFQYAAGNGCTPGRNALVDGDYYGSVTVNEDRSMAFDLKCLFLADDVPDDFSELFVLRFPGQEWSGASFELVDVAASERRVPFAWNGQMTLDGGIFVGDEAYLGFVGREEVPFDAKITIESGVAVTVTELTPGAVPS